MPRNSLAGGTELITTIVLSRGKGALHLLRETREGAARLWYLWLDSFSGIVRHSQRAARLPAPPPARAAPLLFRECLELPSACVRG